MRTYAISLKGSTQQKRQELYDFLVSKKEPMYAGTNLTKKSYDYNYFLYSTEYKNWAGAKTTDFRTLSINNFIAKFINTGDTMSTINVGDVYLNSSGKTCTILEVNGWDIKFKHQDGGTYTSGRDNIAKNWTKQTIKPVIANLQPGTKVRVRSDLRYDRDYYISNSDELESVTKDMVKRASTIVTIDKLNSFGTYCIKEDSGCYNWTDDMFSEIISTTEEQPIKGDLVQTTCKFKVGDIVRLKDGIIHGEKYNNIVFLDNYRFNGGAVVTEIYKSLIEIKVGTFWYGVDALELVPQTLEERITKQLEDQVAQQEPIKSIKKEESFMSKLKATAITTIDQNKEAAIIAAKMEAGRVINKQVIKQAAKYVPFWAKGYLDTPLAPVVLANAVAMLGNHTGNPKVQKVSELMLLAAADVTVQSFNLDQIIDDILAGIKLPAGILDDAE